MGIRGERKEGSSQGTSMKHPWTKTMGQGGGLNVGGEEWVWQERVMGEKWDRQL